MSADPPASSMPFLAASATVRDTSVSRVVWGRTWGTALTFSKVAVHSVDYDCDLGSRHFVVEQAVESVGSR